MSKDGGRRGGRNVALQRFAAAITLFTIVGHLWLGFEQSPLQPLVAVGTAYLVQILIEAAVAWSAGRRPHFMGGVRDLVNFLLSAHITGLAVAMLLYSNDRLWPMAFASAVAIGSKALLRAPVGDRSRHFFNPSNLGISVTLLVFPWVGVVPPYQFTENLVGLGDWALVAGIFTSGYLLNSKLTGRLPLLLAWVGAFVLQAVVRNALFGTPILAGLLPVTGVTFVLFTFYMVTDPGTTPRATRSQVAFGASVAAVYGLMMAVHVVFALFFALCVVCAVRGAWLHAVAWASDRPDVLAGLRRVEALLGLRKRPAVSPAPARRSRTAEVGAPTRLTEPDG